MMVTARFLGSMPCFSRSLFTCSTLCMPKSNLAKLRKKTGYSLSLCKSALEVNEQNVEKAATWLKEQAVSQGWAKAHKLEGRNTKQGLIGLLVRENAAAMVELNCETDFVSRNEQFHNLINEISHVALNQAQEIDVDPERQIGVKHATKDDFISLKSTKGTTIGDLIAINIGQIGEKLELRRGVLLRSKDENIVFAGVTHPSINIHQAHKVQYGRYGSLIAYAKEKNAGTMPKDQTEASMARQLCQHVIGMNPAKIGDISTVKPQEGDDSIQEEEVVEVSEEPLGEGEREDEKVVLRKTHDHHELVHQEFLLDSPKRVGHVLLETGITVKDFVRFEVGQNLDKES